MSDNLLQMQRAAAQRVQQMQEHSRRVLEAHRDLPDGDALLSPGLYSRPAAPTACPSQADPIAGPAAERGGIALPPLEAEQWLLLGLTLLLLRNGCRTELLLALLYLAL